MTDNFNAYKQFITEKWSYSYLPEGDSYFVVELIRRGKDNPDLPAANYHFKNYYIRKPKDLDKYEQEIKSLCEMLHLRAYASVNIKSFKQVSLNTMAELARRIAKNDYRKNYAVFESCSGQYCHSKDKQWVIDLDNCKLHDEYPEEVKELINLCKPDGDKIVTEFPTKSGVHIITTPFDRQQFIELCEVYGVRDADIKKNHLTLLYENL
jgi:hypothetical protein